MFRRNEHVLLMGRRPDELDWILNQLFSGSTIHLKPNASDALSKLNHLERGIFDVIVTLQKREILDRKKSEESFTDFAANFS